MVYKGEVIGYAVFFEHIIGELHIFRSKGVPVGKLDIVSQHKSPD